MSNQCLYGSHCVDLFCVCPKGTKEIDEVCIRIGEMDEENESEEVDGCEENEVDVNKSKFFTRLKLLLTKKIKCI